MTPDIRPLVAGNWKMNGTRASLDQIKAMARGRQGDLSARVDALICPAGPHCFTLRPRFATTSPLMIGAQDCHQKQSGAHTGEVSAEMVADLFRHSCDRRPFRTAHRSWRR